MGTLEISASICEAPDLGAIDLRLRRLRAAMASGRSRVSRLRRWSEFIRERDGHRCVDCHSRERLSAHHICRKSFFGAAEFDTGNGITLCHACHKNVHIGFNGRPNLSQPVDAQGGEKLAFMERLYSILVDDAIERGMLREDFYFLGEEMLGAFKRMQGYDHAAHFPGSRIEQAYLILAEPERQMRHAISETNGFTLGEQPLLPGGMMFVLEDEDAPESGPVEFQGYSSRSAASSDSEPDG